MEQTGCPRGCKTPGRETLWEAGEISTQDLLPTPKSLHRSSFPVPHSLMFPQKFLGVIHSVWFLCLPPPNHLDPIYKPQTAQEFMQGLFWERLGGKCKPDKTERPGAEDLL